jgi:GTPase
MKYRLNEGQGHAVYRIGVSDNGVVDGISQEEMKETMTVLFYMAVRNLDAKIEVQKVKMGINEDSFFAEMTIDRNILQDMK